MKRRNVVIFPNYFLPAEEWPLKTEEYQPMIIVCVDQGTAGSFIHQEFIEMLEENKKKSKKSPSPTGEIYHKVISLDFDGRNYIIFLHPNFMVFDPPLESRSKVKGSRALYYAAHEELGLLLQWLPPYCPTSSHNHGTERWVEKNFLLAGKADLQTNQGRYPLTTTNRVGPTISPDIIHQTLTGNRPSLIVIRIEGDRNWFKKWLTGKGHNFKPLPSAP